MTDGRAAGRTREPTIGDQRNAFAQPHARDHRGGGEHFAHTRTAFGAFVPNHDHIARVDVAGADGCRRILFAVEHPRGTAVHHHFRHHRALLDHGAFGSQIAKQDRDTAVFAQRGFQLVDDLAVRVRRRVNALAHCAADGHQIAMDQSAFVQLFQHRLDAADFVQVGDEHLAGGVQLADLGRLVPDLVNFLQVDGAARRIRDRDDMQHRVGGAADRHIRPQRVFKRGGGQNIARANVLFQQLENLLAGVFRQAGARRIHRRNGTVARQRHADRFGQAVHRVGGVHTRAGAAGGAGILFQTRQLVVVDLAGGMAADRFKHFGQAHPHALVFAGQHRTTADKDGGQIHAARRQQHAGHDFVAVGDKHHRVNGVGGEHHFDGIGDQLART